LDPGVIAQKPKPKGAVAAAAAVAVSTVAAVFQQQLEPS
jgi:hypothetical protein